MLLVILYSSVVSQFFCLYHGGNLRLVGERCMLEEPNWPLHVWAVSKSQYLLNVPIFCWLHHGETSRNLVLQHPPFQFTGLQAVASASLPQVEMLGILVGGRSELTRGPRWAVDVVRISLRRCFWLVVWNMNFMTFHILGRIIPTDFHIFQMGWNHQPVACLQRRWTGRSLVEPGLDPLFGLDLQRDFEMQELRCELRACRICCGCSRLWSSAPASLTCLTL